MTSDMTIFTPPAATPRSADYRLHVNNQEVFVHYCESASYAVFCAQGSVAVVIESLRDCTTAVVRPMRMGVTPQISGRRHRFNLNAPCSATVELNGQLRSPLFIFAMPPETEKPSKDDPSVRYFEAGKVHEPGLIKLVSGETLYIEGGAVVHGIVDCEDCRDVRIRGRGILNGNKYRNEWKREGRQPCLVRFAGCSDVSVEGVTLVDGPSWTLVPNGCGNVTIRDVNIVTCVSTGDGIDIVGCTDVDVQRCFIRADDDCVAIKAVNYFSEKGLADVERVRVSRCVLWNGKPGNALEIGYETRCDRIRDIVFSDCDIVHCEFEGWQSGAAFSIHNSDHSTISNILYENIRVEDCQEKLFDLKVMRTSYTKDDQRGRIAGITFRNISVVDGVFPVSIMRGHAERNNDRLIENVVFENLMVHGRNITNANDARMVVELSENIRFVSHT